MGQKSCPGGSTFDSTLASSNNGLTGTYSEECRDKGPERDLSRRVRCKELTAQAGFLLSTPKTVNTLQT